MMLYIFRCEGNGKPWDEDLDIRANTFDEAISLAFRFLDYTVKNSVNVGNNRPYWTLHLLEVSR